MVKKFRVRLKGFNFMAHVPANAPALALDEKLQISMEPVPPEWLTPTKGATPVPCTVLLLEAKDQADAEARFLKIHAIKAQPRAAFVVEAA